MREHPAATGGARVRPVLRFRWWWAGVGLAALLGVVGLAWSLSAAQPATVPTVPPPVARTLTYQDSDQSIVALDAATGITHTLLSRPFFDSALLDLSPDGASYTYLQSTRPVTATLWNFSLTYTVHLKTPGEAPRTVPISDTTLQPESAWFVSDDSVAVVGRSSPRRLASLYLYDAPSGSSRLLAREVDTVLPLRDQGMLLYTHELTGDGVINPFGIRTVELAALEVSRATTPQPVATWTLHERGSPLRAWPDPDQHAIFYTSYQSEGRAAIGPNWDILALNVLPVQPLGTPQPVATFTSDTLPPALLVSGSGRTLLWRPAAPPSNRGALDSPADALLAPLQMGSVRWSGGAVPSLAAVQTLPDRDAAFALDSDRLLASDQALPSGYGPPPTATRATGPNPAPPGGRSPGLRPTLSPTPGGLPLRIVGPAGGLPPLQVDPAALWVSASAAGPYAVAQGLGDQLLLVSAGPIGADANAPSQLWLATPTGSAWRLQALGAPSQPLPTLSFYGLAPDRLSLFLGVGPDRAGAATLLYQVRLDGSGWQLLDQTAPGSPMLRTEN